MTTDDFMDWLQSHRGKFQFGPGKRIQNSSYRTPTEALCAERGIDPLSKPYHVLDMCHWFWHCLEEAEIYTPELLLSQYLSMFERPTIRDMNYREEFEDYEYRLELRAAMLEVLGLEETS